MHDKLKSEGLDKLFEGILALRGVDECYRFFDDLMTVNELKAFEQRFTVAAMLAKNHLYSKIVAETGASSATVSRVNRSLHYGSDGYKLILERLGLV